MDHFRKIPFPLHAFEKMYLSDFVVGKHLTSVDEEKFHFLVSLFISLRNQKTVSITVKEIHKQTKTRNFLQSKLRFLCDNVGRTFQHNSTAFGARVSELYFVCSRSFPWWSTRFKVRWKPINESNEYHLLRVFRLFATSRIFYIFWNNNF